MPSGVITEPARSSVSEEPFLFLGVEERLGDFFGVSERFGDLAGDSDLAAAFAGDLVTFGEAAGLAAALEGVGALGLATGFASAFSGAADGAGGAAVSQLEPRYKNEMISIK